MNRFVYKISMKRAQKILKPVVNWLKSGDGKILDFGSGLGHIGYLISQETGREITFLDVRKYPYTYPGVNVQIFDGKTIPFPEQEFDTTVIFSVLHHTPNPESSLKEIIRVSRNHILICEDLLVSKKQIKIEIIKDSIANGFLPHMTLQYKTETKWEDLFRDLGLMIVEKIYHESNFIFKFKHVSWLLRIGADKTL